MVVEPCGGGTNKAGCNIVGGWGSGGESRGSMIPAKPGGLAGIFRWCTWACCGACGPLWWLKNGLYGENTCDSCNDGFGIATEVDSAYKWMSQQINCNQFNCWNEHTNRQMVDKLYALVTLMMEAVHDRIAAMGFLMASSSTYSLLWKHKQAYEC